MSDSTTGPTGELVIRTIAMPADANGNGDIFGGWLVSQMDLGGAILARNTAHSRVTTVATDGKASTHPVAIGDNGSGYAQIPKVGTTSMKIDVEAWVQRFTDGGLVRVTEGVFTYVAIDPAGKSHAVNRS